MTEPGDERHSGLRELKKARTRAAIQDHALRLYLKQGYSGTTIEQISEAADVSPSTFFRYFPTKAETVLYDRLDPVMLDALAGQPAELPPLAAVRSAMHSVLGGMSPEELELEQTRWRLIVQVPELRLAAVGHTGETAMLLAEAIGRRVGRASTDIAVLTWVGAFIGAVYAGLIATAQDPDADLLSGIEAALDQMEAGLPL